MESGAKGCEVVVSGKLRGQRAKSMKFVDGLMIHSGDPVNYYVDTAVRHVLLRQGEYKITKGKRQKIVMLLCVAGNLLNTFGTKADYWLCNHLR